MPVHVESDTAGLKRRAEQIEHDLPRAEEWLERVQTTVDDSIALGSAWRSFVAEVVAGQKEFDFRTARDIVLPVAENSRALFSRVTKLLDAARAEGHPVERRADFTLAAHELENLVDWIDAWPTHDPTERNRAREENREGPMLAVKDAIDRIGAVQ